MVPWVMRTSRPNFSSAGEKRNFWMTKLLPGPRERVESSRRMTPSDPSEPVLKVSPAKSFVPSEAGRTRPSRGMAASPAELRTVPMISWAEAGRPPARTDNATRRTATNGVCLMAPFLSKNKNICILFVCCSPAGVKGRGGNPTPPRSMIGGPLRPGTGHVDPAAYREIAPRDEPGLLGSQEKDRPRHVLGQTDPPQRCHPGGHVLFPFREKGGGIGIGKPRREPAADADDAPFLPLHHPGDGGLAAEEGGLHLSYEFRLEIFPSECEEGNDRKRDRGVQDDRVDGPQRPRHLADHRFRMVHIPHVGLHRDRGPAFGLDLRHHLPGGLRAPEVVHRHGRGVPGQEFGGGRADPPASPRHEGPFPFHSHDDL